MAHTEPGADAGTEVHNSLTEGRSASAAELVRRAECYPTLLAALKGAVLGLDVLINVAGPPRNNATAIAGYEDALRRVAQGKAAIKEAS